MSLDAMKQALEALNRAVKELRGITSTQDMSEVIAALRLAIEQAERQEPVAWEPKIETLYQDGFVVRQRIKRTPDGPWEDCAAPPQQEKQEPTPAMIQALTEQYDSDRSMGIGFNPETLCRAVLAAAKGEA
jgi:hypothetical protein